MRQIETADAQAQMDRLLDAVESGESFIITRDGRAVARLLPETAAKRDEAGGGDAGEITPKD